MVAGEPNDVRVERVDRRQWAVLVAENGTVTQHLFMAQEAAESLPTASGQGSAFPPGRRRRIRWPEQSFNRLQDTRRSLRQAV
ncbi:hypothetical protein [Mesorhizobium sp. M0771]|uniref:hypothetical protein n=1 Tax=Mesorhizobium sp. M0771 TaxID=2956997 RepID=UPI00333BBD4B